MTNYDITVKRKTTYLGDKFRIHVNGAPLDLTGASILVQFRKAPLKTVFLELRIGSGITVTDAPNGAFQFDTQVFDLAAGQYGYDVEITLASGKIVNYLYGSLFVQDVFSIPS